MTTSTTLHDTNAGNGITGLIARMRLQLRHAIAMAGAPYVHGPMSPL